MKVNYRGLAAGILFGGGGTNTPVLLGLPACKEVVRTRDMIIRVIVFIIQD